MVEPLDQVAALLKEAAQQKQEKLLQDLWNALTGAAPVVAGRMAETTFSVCRAFLLRARERHLDTFIQTIISRLAEHAEQIAERMGKETSTAIMGFWMFLTSEAQSRIAAYLDTADWGEPRAALSGEWNGMLASRLAAAGRRDVADAIIDHCLTTLDARAYWNPASAILEVSFIMSVAKRDSADLADFVNRVCTHEMLDAAYQRTKCRPLRQALFRMAFHQGAGILKRLWRRSLVLRHGTVRFMANRDEENLIDFVALTGALEMIGLQLTPATFATVDFERLRTLPAAVRPSGEKTGVDWGETQTWLGLRAIARASERAVHVDGDLILETLQRWRATLATLEERKQCSDTAEPTAYRVALSMVAWLERSAADPEGRLIGGDDPLWMLVGFPQLPTVSPAGPS